MSEQLEMELPSGAVETPEKHTIILTARDLEDINVKLVIQGLEAKQDTIEELKVILEEEDPKYQEYAILEFFDKNGELVDMVGMPYFDDLAPELQEIIRKENTEVLDKI